MQAVVQTSSLDGLSKIWNIRWSDPHRQNAKVSAAQSVRNDQQPIYSQQLIEDDKLLVLNGELNAYIRAVEDGHVVRKQGGHTAAVNDVVNFKDLVITASEDSTIRCQDKLTAHTLRTMCGHTGAVTKIKIADLNQNSNKRYQIDFEQNKDKNQEKDQINYQIDKNKAISAKSLDLINIKTIDTDIDYSEKTLISGSKDHTLKLWQIKSGKCIKILRGHTGGITSIATYSDNGDIGIYSGSEDKSVIKWNHLLGIPQQYQIGHNGPITAIQIVDDTLYSGSKDGSIIVWNQDGSIKSQISFKNLFDKFNNQIKNKIINSIPTKNGHPNNYNEHPYIMSQDSGTGITSFDVNDAGTLVAVGLESGWIVVQDLIEGKVNQKQPAHRDMVTSIKIKDVIKND